MANRRPLVNFNGQIAEIPSGDLLTPDTYLAGGGPPLKNITFGLRGATTGDRLDTAIPIPFSGIILSWKLYCPIAISAVLVIKKNGTAISANAKPTLVNANFAESSALTGWDYDLIENDILMISVESTDGQNLVLQLIIQV